jgi:hypothetical protein
MQGGLPKAHKGNNKWYCSDVCSTEAARQSRCRFYKRNPNKISEYRNAAINRNKKAGITDGNLTRFYKRFPDAPRQCEACGESRIVEISHKPEFKRNGMWRSAKNTQLHMVWILCPTCHRLMDRKNYTFERLIEDARLKRGDS